jgi:hypothetical protein
VTANEFRRLALSLPDARRSGAHGHPDFPRRRQDLATLGSRGLVSGVLLTPEQQELFVRTEPRTVTPVPGGWGRQGSTQVVLRTAKRSAVREALNVAWSNRAPGRKK